MGFGSPLAGCVSGCPGPSPAVPGNLKSVVYHRHRLRESGGKPGIIQRGLSLETAEWLTNAPKNAAHILNIYAPAMGQAPPAPPHSDSECHTEYRATLFNGTKHARSIAHTLTLLVPAMGQESLCRCPRSLNVENKPAAPALQSAAQSHMIQAPGMGQAAPRQTKSARLKTDGRL